MEQYDNNNTQQSTKSGTRIVCSALRIFGRLLEWEYIRNRGLAAAGVEGIIPIFVVNVLGMVGEHVIFFEIDAGRHRATGVVNIAKKTPLSVLLIYWVSNRHK